MNNRWVRLANAIPWDVFSGHYYRQMDTRQGTPAKDARLILGAVIIKHMENLSDEDTIDMIRENIYMQYFVGLPSFQTEKIFEPSLFVSIRKRLPQDFWNDLNAALIAFAEGRLKKDASEPDQEREDDSESEDEDQPPSNKGELLLDATTVEQDIAYPNDLDLANQSRVKADELITKLCNAANIKRPRTYPIVARKAYLNTAKKKNRSRKEIRKAVSKQLRYLKRNLDYLDRLLAGLPTEVLEKALNERDLAYYETIQRVYAQQKFMLDNRTHSIPDRIVSIHQPHVRPMVRGKSGSNVEFGSKIDVSIHNGYARIERMEWDNYHEAATLPIAAENYKAQYGYYPEKMIVDRKYCTRENRTWCSENNIKLSAKPLGRPTQRTLEQLKELLLDNGKRNAVEGKFGQAKRAYGMDYIKARLQNTSESWIGSIVLVLNLVRWDKLLEQHTFFPFFDTLYCWIQNVKIKIIQIINPTLGLRALKY